MEICSCILHRIICRIPMSPIAAQKLKLARLSFSRTARVNRHWALSSTKPIALGAYAFLNVAAFCAVSASEPASTDVVSPMSKNSSSDNSIHPFRVAMPQAAIDDLMVRLDRIHWADELP